MGSWCSVRASGVEVAPRKRSQRSVNFLKLFSLCPIIWHELHELHELPLLIKDLQRERGQIKHERHEPFIIKDLERT
jgi:hypothetical protein